MLRVKEHLLIFSSVVFIFELAFESFKDFGDALGEKKSLKQVVCK
jgi:hypothetical protein